jgi:hypothetical protein
LKTLKELISYVVHKQQSLIYFCSGPGRLEERTERQRALRRVRRRHGQGETSVRGAGVVERRPPPRQVGVPPRTGVPAFQRQRVQSEQLRGAVQLALLPLAVDDHQCADEPCALSSLLVLQPGSSAHSSTVQRRPRRIFVPPQGLFVHLQGRLFYRKGNSSNYSANLFSCALFVLTVTKFLNL